jgi:hypothetical protein
MKELQKKKLTALLAALGPAVNSASKAVYAHCEDASRGLAENEKFYLIDFVHYFRIEVRIFTYIQNVSDNRKLFRPPLWSSGQHSWLHIERSRFDSRRYQIFWNVAGLERGPLSLVSTIEELLARESNGSDLETREYGRIRRADYATLLCPQKLRTNFADKRRSGHGVCLFCLRMCMQRSHWSTELRVRKPFIFMRYPSLKYCTLSEVT